MTNPQRTSVFKDFCDYANTRFPRFEANAVAMCVVEMLIARDDIAIQHIPTVARFIDQEIFKVSKSLAVKYLLTI